MTVSVERKPQNPPRNPNFVPLKLQATSSQSPSNEFLELLAIQLTDKATPAQMADNF
jgi:hypothetical protein